MKKNWQLESLKEVCLIRPPKSEVKSKLNDSDLVSFVPMEKLGVDQKYFTSEDERKLSSVIKSYTYFKENDVILAKITPCFENGKLGIAKNLKNEVGFGSSEFVVYRTSNNLLPEYLYYFLYQPSLRGIGKARMVGAVGHKRIPKDFYEDYKIPLPPLPTQKQIVEKLDKAFAAIDKAKANIEKNIQNAEELFQAKLANIFSLTEEKWLTKKLEECIKLKSGVGLTGKQMTNTGEFPVYGGNGITGTHNKFNIEGPNIIIGRVGALCGNVRFVNEKIWLTDNAFRVSELYYEFDKEFLSIMLDYKNLRGTARQAAQPVISNSSVKEIVLSFPERIDDQKEIVKIIKVLNRNKMYIQSNYEKKKLLLEELKNSLLQKAFTGELTK